MDTINNRRSVRAYQERAVEPEKIDRMLRSAMQAPSAGNQQPWEFLVVERRESLDRLSRMSPYAGMLTTAPLAVVLLCDRDRLEFAGNWQQDMSAAAENLLLEAVELGLGGVWLGVAPLPEREQAIRAQFSLPEHILPFAVLSLGYPQDDNANHFTDRYDAGRIHRETYSAG